MAGLLLFRSTKERPVKNGKNLLASHNQTLAKLLGCLLALVAIGHGSEAAILTVTDTGDTIEIDGLVTLREAITSANDNANVNADVVAAGAYGTDTINFNIAGAGPHTIAPAATKTSAPSMPLEKYCAFSWPKLCSWSGFADA